jgi:hypothetical protein
MTNWAACNVCDADFDRDESGEGVWCEAPVKPFWLCSGCYAAVVRAALDRAKKIEGMLAGEKGADDG